MKNTMLQYRGGGCDGCFWEWNACFWDSKGVWHDINASGRAGLELESQALEYLKDKTKFYGGPRAEAFIIKLDKPNSVKKFVKDSALMFVISCASVVNDLEDKDIIGLECPDCKNTIYPNSTRDKDYSEWQFDPNNYHGDGGIGIVFEGFICSDCYCGHTCGYCGEFHSDLNELMINDGEIEDRCTYCASDDDIKKFNDKQEK